MTRVLFVSDRLAADPRSDREARPGGAELTDRAAIEACPWPIAVRRFGELEARDLAADVIVVSNAATARPDQLAAIARGGRHVMFEHDVRICRWRGDYPRATEARHRWLHRCGCDVAPWRELVARAHGVVYLTRLQREHYAANPGWRAPGGGPHAGREAVLGSSLFCRATLARLSAPTRGARSHTAIAWSANRIKGHTIAWDHCRARGWPVRMIRQRSYDETLALLAASERFVHLPLGLEPAGRLPIEARLVGCEVVTDAHVGVTHEPLWTMDRAGALAALEAAPRRFWRVVEALASGRADEVLPAPPAPPSSWRELASVRPRAALDRAWLSERVARAVAEVRVSGAWM